MSLYVPDDRSVIMQRSSPGVLATPGAWLNLSERFSMDTVPHRRCSVEGCEGKHKARGLCVKHYERIRKHGTLEPKLIRGDDVSRLWSYVDKTEGCWLWRGNLDGGYGRLSIKDKLIGAHKYSYQLAYGPIPDGLEVCHKCDVPNCVRPDHLWLGTHSQNMLDCYQKGRGRPPKGSENKNSKLKEADVIEIRLLLTQGVSQRQIAKQFGVGSTAIREIQHGRTWRHV